LTAPFTHGGLRALPRQCFRIKKRTAFAVRFLLCSAAATGAFEKFIFRQGARDFGLDSVMKGEGILCVFQTFHKPEPSRRIRSPDENQF